MEFFENQEAPAERTFVYRVLRYVPNLVRGKPVNIGVLLYDPQTAERRLRLIEEPAEFRRVRRLHPGADEGLLRALRDDLDKLFVESLAAEPIDGSPRPDAWGRMLAIWDDTLSHALQLTPQKGVIARDLDIELERLYADHVALESVSPVAVRASRATLRGRCGQVFRQARIWDRLEKLVSVSPYTFPGDPMRLDFAYRRNGTQGFVHTLSVTRSPADAKLLAYTADRIAKSATLKTEFLAVTDVQLDPHAHELHKFVSQTLQSSGISSVALEDFAAWVSQLAPLLPLS